MKKIIILVLFARLIIEAAFMPLAEGNWWIYKDSTSNNSSFSISYKCYKVIGVSSCKFASCTHGDTIFRLAYYSNQSLDTTKSHLLNNSFSQYFTYETDSNYVYRDSGNDSGLMPYFVDSLNQHCLPSSWTPRNCTTDTFAIYLIGPGGFTGYWSNYANNIGLISINSWSIQDASDKHLIECFNTSFINIENNTMPFQNDFCLIKPCPASHFIVISGVIPIGYIKLFDVNGKLVLNQVAKNSLMNNLPLPKLSKGLYIIQLSTMSRKYLSKIIII